MSVSIIQSLEKLNDVKFNKDSIVVMDFVMSNDVDFIKSSKIGCLMMYLDGNYYQIGLGHPDIPSMDHSGVFDIVFNKIDGVSSVFLFDSKKISHLDERFLKFNCLSSFIHTKSGEIFEKDTTFSHKYYSSRIKSKTINFLIPASKHMESFMHNISEISIPTKTELMEPGYSSVIQSVLPQFYKIEKHGMFVDEQKLNHFFGKSYTGNLSDKYVYSNYNIWSATGRPSNSFGGINLAALDKSNGERSTFISRFGNDGMLALFDFKAYHPRLLAKLSNFEIPSSVDDIYEWLSKQMFKKDILTSDEISKGKGNVFQQLYGKIEDKNLSVPYFRSIQNYMDHRWKFFNKCGYVDTPIYKRGITENHLKGAFSNKVTNYILQAYETERNCEIMKVLFEFLSDKISVPVLYNYDSILFDLHKDDGKKTITEIKNIMETDGFPVTIKVGKDFHDMKKI